MEFILYPYYSWQIRPHYQWNLPYAPAKAGKSGHITNGIYLIPLLQLTHQATLPMESVTYPCYTWHNRPHYQWTLSYTPATADKSGHITNGIYLIPLLKLANQATLPMEFILYPCYSWQIRPHYQWNLSYTPATADTSGHIINGVSHIPLL